MACVNSPPSCPEYSPLPSAPAQATKQLAALGLLIAVVRTPGLLGSSYWWLPWVAVMYYLAAGISAGVVVGLLFPLARTLVGRLLVGFVATYPVSIGAMLLGATVQK